MLKIIFNSLTNTMLQRRIQNTIHRSAARSADVKLSIDAKQAFSTLGNQWSHHLTESTCTSMDKNYLHHYQILQFIEL